MLDSDKWKINWLRHGNAMTSKTDMVAFVIILLFAVIGLLMFAPETITEPASRSPEQAQLDTIYMHVEEIRQGVREVTEQLRLLCLDLTEGNTEYCDS